LLLQPRIAPDAAKARRVMAERSGVRRFDEVGAIVESKRVELKSME
jgi:hypothetical protein